MLDVIEKRPSRESDNAPVLFVHGAWHGAWCWDEHFLDFFAAKGYRSLAVSLRGHGKSPAPKSMVNRAKPGHGKVIGERWRYAGVGPRNLLLRIDFPVRYGALHRAAWRRVRVN